MKRHWSAALAAMFVSGSVITPAAFAENCDAATEACVFIFGGEGNRLNAYDHATGAKQTVIPSASDPNPGDGREKRDLNAQICFSVQTDPDSGEERVFFIGGEDTAQGGVGDPGWGWFELAGRKIGDFRATQRGKLVPTWQPTSPFFGAENYGCGFLPDGRLLTSDVGDQFPGFPGTGQLILWFPDNDEGRPGFTQGFHTEAGIPRGDVPYCKIDTALATAGGIHIAEEDGETVVYAASARPGTEPEPWGIFRYSGDFPTSNDASGGCGRTDGTGAPLVDAGRITKEIFVPATPLGVTPSAIAPSGKGTFYVSSVFDGNVGEYDANGLFLRHVVGFPTGSPLALPVGQIANPSTPLGNIYAAGTPFGIAVAPDGTLYYTDIGVLTVETFRPGSLFRVAFDANGTPGSPQSVDTGLAFPDGLGVLELAP